MSNEKKGGFTVLVGNDYNKSDSDVSLQICSRAVEILKKAI